MQIYSEFLGALKLSLEIASFALIISVLPGLLLFWGKTCKWTSVNMLAAGIISIFQGIPLIIQLFVFFYWFPMISPNLPLSQSIVAVLVLTFNAMTEIASNGEMLAQTKQVKSGFVDSIKIVIATSVSVWGRLFNYTALLSIIGMTDLFRYAKVISSAKNDAKVLVWAILIYLVVYIVVKILYKGLISIFFDLKKVPVIKN